MSSRNNRTVAAGGRSLGPADLARLNAAGKNAAGTRLDAVPPSVEAVRAAIDAGKCPFCGSGPWKMLPVHTNKIHGVDKWELRDMAGLSSNDPLCSVEAREAMRAAAFRNPAAVRRATAASRVRRTRPRRTIAGRQRNTDSLARWVEENPAAAHEVRSKAGVAGGVAWAAIRRRSATPRVAEASAPDRRVLVRECPRTVPAPGPKTATRRRRTR